MKTNPNDPATGYGFTTADGSSHQDQSSLTKREHFADMAMQGFINTGHVRVDHKSGTVENLYNYAVIAKSCVDQADALIEALNKQEE